MEEEIWTEKEFRAWLMNQVSAEYTIEEKGNKVIYTAGNYTGYVIFDEEMITELMILDQNEDNKFYLHFLLNQKDHAIELASEMLEVLIKLKNSKSTNILLTCSCALTTSFFAMQLNDTAASLNLDYHFEAVNIDSIYTAADNFDAVLIAPQEGYQYKKVASILKDKVVLKIPAAIFGTYDTSAMIELVKKELAAKQKPVEEPLQVNFTGNHCILAIGLLNRGGDNRVAYRVYDHGNIVMDHEIIKPSIVPDDILDLIDYASTAYKNIDMIGLAIPGVVYKGKVTYQPYQLNHTDLAMLIKKHCALKTIVINDVNAMTLGYAASHENSENMTFLFQNRKGDSSLGMMIDGKLHMGYMHNAGELESLQRRFDPEESIDPKKPEDALKMVSLALHTCICTYAPEKIAVYSELTPDIEEVKEDLKKYIDPSFIPEMVHISGLKKHMLPGIMIRCEQILSDPEKVAKLETGLTENN